MLTAEYIRRTLGPSIMEAANEYRLSAWLGQQEDQHRIVLYQCDQSLTPWTLRCIRQADCILIVALATMGPTVGAIEKKLETIAVRTQKELILLHKQGGDKPKNTVDWLNARSWCSSHHHIQCPARMFSKKSTSRSVSRQIFYYSYVFTGVGSKYCENLMETVPYICRLILQTSLRWNVTYIQILLAWLAFSPESLSVLFWVEVVQEVRRMLE